MTGKELWYIAQAHTNGQLAGDGLFTRRCTEWLEQRTGAQNVLLTNSCTAALEMAAILVNASPGDEIIMPSYTFVSTANAFVLRGAKPVFVDILPKTLNIDESKIESAITKNTKAIVVVHYGGIACNMDVIMAIAEKYNLFVIEDAAQAVMSSFRGQSLGSIGHLGALSFHETKNIISGEGGALLVNKGSLIERAEILRDKGTDRSRYFRGEVDKYSWVDLGSSYLPSELVAAFLWGQMEEADQITSRRLQIWKKYREGLRDLENKGLIRGPVIPPNCNHNAHMYYVLLRTEKDRNTFIDDLKKEGIHSVFHFVPLHDSLMGREYGRVSGDMGVTNDLSRRIVRLPLWLGIEEHQDMIIDVIRQALLKADVQIIDD